jgi:hypothetical protein
MTDEAFEAYLSALSKQVPKWVRCSKKEYDTYCPEGPEFKKVLLRACNVYNFKKESDETGTKFKYYKIGGYDKVLVCGAQQAEWINERQKLMKK